MHVYSVLNIAGWLVLAALLWRLLPVNDGRGLVAWVGLLFSAGVLGSVRFALTDLPSVILVAAALGAAERARLRTAVGWLAAAALTRETSLVALARALDRPLEVARCSRPQSAAPPAGGGSVDRLAHLYPLARRSTQPRCEEFRVAGHRPAGEMERVLPGPGPAQPSAVCLCYPCWPSPASPCRSRSSWRCCGRPTSGGASAPPVRCLRAAAPRFRRLGGLSRRGRAGAAAAATSPGMPPCVADPGRRWPGSSACNLTVFSGLMALREVPHNRMELAWVRTHGVAVLLRFRSRLVWPRDRRPSRVVVERYARPPRPGRLAPDGPPGGRASPSTSLQPDAAHRDGEVRRP